MDEVLKGGRLFFFVSYREEFAKIARKGGAGKIPVLPLFICEAS